MSKEKTNNQVTLYIGTHNDTGLKYFGKTYCYFTKEDLQKHYHGSGRYWKDHLKIHGDDVTMEIYGIYSLDENSEDYVKPIALKFSKDNNIVSGMNKDGKKVWGNLELEDGLNGGNGKNLKKLKINHLKRENEITNKFFDKVKYNLDIMIKEEYKPEMLDIDKRRSATLKGRIKSKQECLNISNTLKGKKKSTTHIENNRLSNMGRVTAFDIFKNETVTTNELEFLENKHYIGIQAKKFFICDNLLMRGKDLELYAKSKGFMGTNFAYKSDKFRLKFISSIEEINREQYIKKSILELT